MLTTEQKRIYAQFRAAGYSAVESKRSADIVAQFRAHQWDESYDPEPEDIGAMRIRLEHDDNPYDPGETLEPYRGSDGRWRSREENQRELDHMLEACGVWGTIGEVWTGDDWEQVDSVWGHAGYKNPDCPIENIYVVDHMRACLALRAKLGENVAALP